MTRQIISRLFVILKHINNGLKKSINLPLKYLINRCSNLNPVLKKRIKSLTATEQQTIKNKLILNFCFYSSQFKEYNKTISERNAFYLFVGIFLKNYFDPEKKYETSIKEFNKEFDVTKKFFFILLHS